MKLQQISGEDPRKLMRAVECAVFGQGPAIAVGSAEKLPDHVPDGTALVLTTSGSTGVPKSVLLSRDALRASAAATTARIGEGQWLLPLAGGYIAGVQVMVRALAAGQEVTFLEGKFTAESFAYAVSGMDMSIPAYTSLVPAQLQTLVDAAEHDEAIGEALAAFHTILVGGQRLTDPLRDRAIALGANPVRTYGSTETAGGCVYDGRPLDGTTAKIVGGEIRFSGPSLADGYLGDPERTADIFVTETDGSRWYRTGDAGTIEDGVVSVTGRIDNVIISGGINVSLDRVEAVTQEIIADAVIVGAPHARWGETPVVVTAIGGELEAVRAAVEREIGKPARPERILLVPEIPRLTSGKPDRRAIREFARADSSSPPAGPFVG